MSNSDGILGFLLRNAKNVIQIKNLAVSSVWCTKVVEWKLGNVDGLLKRICKTATWYGDSATRQRQTTSGMAHGT